MDGSDHEERNPGRCHGSPGRALLGKAIDDARAKGVDHFDDVQTMHDTA
jgi:hypothetical protein